MATIIAGTLITLLVVGLVGTKALFACIPVIIFILLIPCEGYCDRKCEVIDLIKLKGYDESKTYYVAYKKGKAQCAFDNSETYDLDGPAYESLSVKGEIKVYESKSCEQPILKIYTTKPERGVMTFAPFSTKREYVFYVPENTVVRKGMKE